MVEPLQPQILTTKNIDFPRTCWTKGRKRRFAKVDSRSGSMKLSKSGPRMTIAFSAVIWAMKWLMKSWRTHSRSMPRSQRQKLSAIRKLWKAKVSASCHSSRSMITSKRCERCKANTWVIVLSHLNVVNGKRKVHSIRQLDNDHQWLS